MNPSANTQSLNNMASARPSDTNPASTHAESIPGFVGSMNFYNDQMLDSQLYGNLIMPGWIPHSPYAVSDMYTSQFRDAPRDMAPPEAYAVSDMYTNQPRDVSRARTPPEEPYNRMSGGRLRSLPTAPSGSPNADELDNLEGTDGEDRVSPNDHNAELSYHESPSRSPGRSSRKSSRRSPSLPQTSEESSDSEFEDELIDDAQEDGGVIAWYNLEEDSTIPTGLNKQRKWVRRIRNAIANTFGVNEKDSVAHPNRWGDGTQYYPRLAFEKLAWRIVEYAVAVHIDGWSDEVFDPLLWKAIKSNEKDTFKVRMKDVMELLSMSKRTCEDLLKGERLSSVVGAPKMLISRCKGNQRSNQIRGDKYKRVMAAVDGPDSTRRGRKRKVAEDELDVEVGESSKKTGRPKKRTRRA